jgi:ornithine cyclodeaminase/alanine dehydrogenase-like protein (mu-crystallin family)
MPALYLTEADVEVLLDMPMAVAVVQEAFRQLAAGQAANVPRQRAIGRGIVLHSMSAVADYLGLAGWKCYTTTKAGAKFLVGLYDTQTGSLVALIEANRLGQLRTGATTAVAVQHLSPPTADRLGLLGTGWQAEAQLAAVAAVRKLRRAAVYGRDAGRRAAFAETMSQRLGVEVVPVENARLAVEGQALVVTATSSRRPVLEGAWLSPGTFLAAMGSNWLEKAEIDAAAVARAKLVVCDDVACCQHEAGDFREALKQGRFQWADAVNLADIVSGRHSGRGGSDEIVLFKSVGMALEDVAVGHRVLALARERGLGRELPL